MNRDYSVVNRNGDVIMHDAALIDAEYFARFLSEGVNRHYTVARADGTVVSVWINGKKQPDKEGEA